MRSFRIPKTANPDFGSPANDSYRTPLPVKQPSPWTKHKQDISPMQDRTERAMDWEPGQFSPIEMPRPRRPSLSQEQQNIQIPSQLLRSNADEVLQQADDQLKSGRLTEENHQVLIKQLSQLYKLQKIKQQIMDEKTVLKNTVEAQEKQQYPPITDPYAKQQWGEKKGPVPNGKNFVSVENNSKHVFKT